MTTRRTNRPCPPEHGPARRHLARLGLPVLPGCLCLALCAMACQSRGTPQNTYTVSEGAVSEGGVSGGEHVERSIGSPALQRALVLEDVRTQRRDGRLHAQFRLHNTRGSEIDFEWALEWFDADGFRIDTPLHWTPAVLGGGGYETVARTAPTAEASSFSLAVRKPNPAR